MILQNDRGEGSDAKSASGNCCVLLSVDNSDIFLISETGGSSLKVGHEPITLLAGIFSENHKPVTCSGTATGLGLVLRNSRGKSNTILLQQ